MNDGASQIVANQIYDGLIRISSKLVLEPALAKSWITSKDGLTLTFHLRTDAKFHDGRAITAVDVVFSLTRAMSSAVVAKLYDCIERDMHGRPHIYAIGLHTVTITLKKPFPPILSVLAGVTAKILPDDFVRRNPKFFEAPIGSGPFQFVIRDDKKREIVLRGNASYYDGAPKISLMVLKESTLSQAVALTEVESTHEIVTPPLPARHEVFRTGKRLSSPVVATWVIGLNTRLPPLDRIEVRRALKTALEMDSFRKEFYPDAMPAYGYIPPGLPGYLHKKVSTPAKADASVLRNLPAIKVEIPDALESVDQMSAHLKNIARRAGIEIEVVPTPWDQLMNGYTAHRSAAFLVSMSVDYPDSEFLLQNFESKNADSFSGLKDPELDRLIHESRTAQDRVKREALHLKAVRRLESLAVAVNLFHPRQNLWVHECVQGLSPHLMGDIYLDYRKVQIDETCMNLKVAKR
jgi:ABC-type transport system substrate-binding protein